MESCLSKTSRKGQPWVSRPKDNRYPDRIISSFVDMGTLTGCLHFKYPCSYGKVFIKENIICFLTMAKSNFLMLDLDDAKTKKVANIVGNESCRKILNLLTERSYTESELAKELNIPISTIHYNLQQLIEGGLVVTDEFHYSDKGKEVNHYKLANKYIIIAPKKPYGIKQKLRSILPALGIAALVSALIHFWTRMQTTEMTKAMADTAQEVPRRTFEKAAESAVASEAAQTMGNASSQAADVALMTANQTAEIVANQAPVFQAKVAAYTGIASYVSLWFLLGATFALIAYFLLSVVRK